MIVLGLTGSIGMGKTIAARHFRYFGVPVYDSDKSVHDLLRENKRVIELVSKYFPRAVINGVIDRKLLGDKVFGDLASLNILERILYPFVHLKIDRFLRLCSIRRVRLAVLDIPLLFEKNRESDCDLIAVASAPNFIQNYRVMNRPGMTLKKYQSILSTQLSDKEKRKRADFIINSSLGKRESFRKVQKIINITRRWPNQKRPSRNPFKFFKNLEGDANCDP